jgi:vacuolar-type H+-ATPase subunit H
MSSIKDFGFKKEKKTLYGVIIYNMDQKLKNELFKQFVKALIDSFNPETNKSELYITDRELMLAYLPQLTDLEFNTDNELEVLKIIDNPDERLEEIMDEIKEPIKAIMKKASKYVRENVEDILEATEGMTEEQIDKYFEELEKFNKKEEIVEEEKDLSEDELKEFRNWKKSQKVGK